MPRKKNNRKKIQIAKRKAVLAAKPKPRRNYMIGHLPIRAPELGLVAATLAAHMHTEKHALIRDITKELGPQIRTVK